MADSIKNIDDKNEVDKLLNEVFTNPTRTGYVEVGPHNICLPVIYTKYEERLRKFKIFNDDVFLAGFPKSGTTWCHEMIWLIMHDLDFEGAKIDCDKRYRLLEMAILYDIKTIQSDFLEVKDPLDMVEKLDRPRCIKTHLHWSLLPEDIRNGSKHPKIINIRRNPKDSCISHYHFSRFNVGFTGTFEEFCEIYLAGRVPYGPYWKHIFSYWNKRHRQNFLVITYEEMVNNLPSVIKKIAQFLNKTVTSGDIEKLVKHLSFESMKNNPAMKDEVVTTAVAKKYNLNTGEASFFREGKVGGFKTRMTPEIDKRFSDWIEQNIKGTDYTL